ncbi:MAG: tetraacyldisaccharide 4'-kinase [Porticoccaceae bacterium]|nr:tetraacyldisaccharide 4'-kinase [Porticoccaceae bacterium]
MSAERFWTNAWYQKSTWLVLLVPLSWLFRAISRFRRIVLQWRFQGQSYAMPVVVIGNISLGGSGKTPLIIALAKALSERGYSVGVVSRGYGGASAQYPLVVRPDTPVSQSGDEPLLVAKKLGCPVVVDPNRGRAVEKLVESFSCDLILSDDGLQHYRLHRDVEIAVVDGRRRFGNGYTLPAGPLRESPRRLKEVDFIIQNGGIVEPDDPGTYIVQLETSGLRRFGSSELIGFDQWVESTNIHAVAAIGHPERFFESLRQMGFKVDSEPKNDHQTLTALDIGFDDDLPVVITAKDAVKYQGLVPDNLWVLEVEMELDNEFVSSLIDCVGLTVTSA